MADEDDAFARMLAGDATKGLGDSIPDLSGRLAAVVVALDDGGAGLILAMRRERGVGGALLGS